MAFLQSPKRAAALALFASIAVLVAGASARAQAPERAKIDKRLAELKDQIAQEEQRLAKKKVEAEGEYAKVRDAVAIGKVASEVKKIVDEFAGKAGEAKSARRDIAKKVDAAFKQGFGAIVGAAIAPVAAKDLSDKLEAGATPPASEVVNDSINYVFIGDAPFEDAWKEILLRAEVAKALRDLSAERRSLQARVEEIVKAESARIAGIPHGMVEVPTGKFRIGIDDKEIDALATRLGYPQESLRLAWTSTPAHEIGLDGFYIDQNEVTCAWWAAYMRDNKKAPAPKGLWVDGKYPEGWENRPVTGISYEAALDFAHWMGRRLPTEEEWEAAARYSTNPKERRIFPWGDDMPLNVNVCNYGGTTNVRERNTANGLPPMTPAGTFPEGKSFLGLNDLAGNAYEMTSSPFKPYSGFKEKDFKGNKVGFDGFSEEDITLRGGDAIKRDVIVTTFSRLKMGRKSTSPLVGFRTALSKLRGKDLIADIVRQGDVPAWIVDYPPLPEDISARRKNAILDFENPNAYTSKTAGGWDPENNVPSAAKHIFICSRVAENFRDQAMLKMIAKGMPDETVMVGLLHLDVPTVEPALEPGDWFVLWSNSHMGTVEPAGVDLPDDPKKDEKGAKKPAKAPAAKKTVSLPEALIFEKRGGKERLQVRVESPLPMIVGDAQPSKIETRSDDTVTLIYSYPVGTSRGKKSFLISLQLKLPPGEVAKFR